LASAATRRRHRPGGPDSGGVHGLRERSGERAMPTCDDWRRVFYHEAGHAVIAVLQGESAPIVARCVEQNGALRAEGSFQFPLGVDESSAGNLNAILMRLVQRAAAGKVAEEIRFQAAGSGITGDMTKIGILLHMDLNGAPTAERNNDFPQTRALLNEHWHRVERIAEIAHRRFCRMEIPDGAFQNRQVLSRTAVQRIHDGAALSDEEHARATEGAFLYALQRGGGNRPPYEHELARDDFARAAGDVLGAILD